MLLAGFENNEDCGVMLYNENDEYAMLSSVDFITPVVDDPYIYGQIAAANALSDIFAMGGIAKSALNLLMWDSTHFDVKVANAILKGGLDKITESGALLLGGHTIKDTEQKYGLSVNGVVHKNRIWRNNTAQENDVLVLTKPLGSGILTTAIKARMLHNQEEVIKSMAMLNLYAMQVAQNYEIHACTDITGFGLIGHALEMCRANITKKSHSPLLDSTQNSPYDKSILFYTTQIPLFENTKELSKMGIVPGGSYENKNALSHQVQIQSQIDDDIFYYDAQTSGGLLFALPFAQAKAFAYDLRKAGITYANIVGEILPKREKAIILG